MARSHSLIAVAGASFALLAGPAAAQDDGVYIDPDSAAAKEYAIPLDSARRAAQPQAGTGGEGAAASTAPAAAPAVPLFGEGVEKRRGGGSDSAGGSADDPAARTPEPGEPGGALRPTASVQPSASFWTFGIAGAILLLGGSAAFALRRFARSS